MEIEGERKVLQFPNGACIIHGDFRIDNLIVDAEDPFNIVAVLDWEMATLGDPSADLLPVLPRADEGRPLCGDDRGCEGAGAVVLGDHRVGAGGLGGQAGSALNLSGFQPSPRSTSMAKSIVHVIGTIGEPLIGLLAIHKDEFGIDEVTFHKNMPYSHDRICSRRFRWRPNQNELASLKFWQKGRLPAYLGSRSGHLRGGQNYTPSLSGKTVALWPSPAGCSGSTGAGPVTHRTGPQSHCDHRGGWPGRTGTREWLRHVQ